MGNKMAKLLLTQFSQYDLCVVKKVIERHCADFEWEIENNYLKSKVLFEGVPDVGKPAADVELCFEGMRANSIGHVLYFNIDKSLVNNEAADLIELEGECYSFDAIMKCHLTISREESHIAQSIITQVKSIKGCNKRDYAQVNVEKINRWLQMSACSLGSKKGASRCLFPGFFSCFRQGRKSAKVCPTIPPSSGI